MKYNTTNVTSASFEKSIKALETAEYFNYSVASGIPPYRNCHFGDGTKGSYEPLFDDNCDTWANWVNRSIFETFQKSDLGRMRKSTLIPMTDMVYALRVIQTEADNASGMNISNAFEVQISFKGIFGWPMATRFSYSNQDVILDKDLNIIKVRYYPFQMVS